MADYWHIFLLLVLILYFVESGTHNCNERQFSCADKKQCIPLTWQCDGEEDCKDKSDELNCRYKPCKEYEFQCTSKKCIAKTDLCDGFNDCSDGGDESKDLCQKRTSCNTTTHFVCSRGKPACIPKSKVCDGIEDCMDLSDETYDACTKYKKYTEKQCRNDEFNCTTGGCISLTFRCDGKQDCEDNSDEMHCIKPKDKCASDEFKCKSGSPKCIDLSKRCDKYHDCSDKSDEKDCPNFGFDPAKYCPLTDDFNCGLPRCISLTWRCDGEPDCPNAADERNCVSTTCPPPKLACNKGNKCLHPLQKCDGKPDCPDGSDEENCPPRVKEDECKNKFLCGSGTKKCVDWSQVCDGRADCTDGEDEQPGGNRGNCQLNPCKNMNGGCTHICHNRFTRHYCSCPPGLSLDKSDNETCVDVNECNIWGSCSQKCENIKGSYKCSCDIGYVTDRLNKTRCVANSEKSLLLATQEYIREYHMESYDERLIVSDLINVESLEYDIRSEPRRVFWAQPTPPALYMSTFGKESKSRKKIELYNGNNSLPEGIAYDWVHKLLYMSDRGLKRIAVLNVSSPTTGVAVIASGDIEEPRALAVDPLNGWLYWSDWGRKAKISKIGMDGRFRKVLVDTEITLPNGIALDMPQRRLYWCDAKLHSISTVDFDGGDRRLIYNDTDIYPYSLSVFEDRIYWSDWFYDSVLSVNKFHAKVYKKLFEKHRISAIRIIHKLMQPALPNRCINHHCSHFCLPSPLSGHLKKDPSYRCACPESMSLQDDDRTCIESASTRMPTTNVARTIKTDLTTGTTSSGTSITSTYKNIEPSSTSTLKGHRSITAAPRKVETTTASNNSTILTQLQSKNVGHVAGIAIGVIFLVFILVAASMLIFYRIYSRRNIRSMNFDNPVYRKANGDADTEAQYPMNGSIAPNNRTAHSPIWTGGMDNDAVEA